MMLKYSVVTPGLITLASANRPRTGSYWGLQWRACPSLACQLPRRGLPPAALGRSLTTVYWTGVAGHVFVLCLTPLFNACGRPACTWKGPGADCRFSVTELNAPYCLLTRSSDTVFCLTSPGRDSWLRLMPSSATDLPSAVWRIPSSQRVISVGCHRLHQRCYA